MDSEKQKKLVGQRLNAALALRNQKQKDLAKVLGVQDNTISYFCKGERTPNTVQLAEISRYLKVSSDYLLGLTDVASSAANIRDIVETTGLTEENARKLSAIEKRKEEYPTFKTTVDFINFLVAQACRPDLIDLVDQMGQALNMQSIDACTDLMIQEMVTESDAEPYSITEEAVEKGVEAALGGPTFIMSQWTLSPEEAFRFYCFSIVDELKVQLLETYKAQNHWTDMEGQKELVADTVRKYAAMLADENASVRRE